MRFGIRTRYSRLIGVVVAVIVLTGVSVFAGTSKSTLADCDSSPMAYGRATMTINVTVGGTYRVWSRMQAANSTFNSFYMQIDNTVCNAVVGGSSNISSTDLTWVDYLNGNAATKNDVTLGAGTHTIIIAARDPGITVDRIILTGDTSCVPTGTGDNCANPTDQTAPVVSITSPADQTKVSGASVNVQTAASDNVGVTKVEMYLDNVLAGTDTSAPYNFSVSTSGLAPGGHQLVARAYDVAGNSSDSSAIAIIIPDSTKPAVSLTLPVDGATVSGSRALKATATDNIGVTKVEFYVDGNLYATDTTSPYSVTWDTTTVSNSTHKLTAKAYDAANNSQSSSDVTVTVNNTTNPPDASPPVVNVTAPTVAAIISGTSDFTADATDDVGVTKVELYVDNKLVNTDTTAPYSYSLDTKTLTNSTHMFTAKAYDAAGHVSTSDAIPAIVLNITYLPEDFDHNGKIDFSDLYKLYTEYKLAEIGQAGPYAAQADLNNSGGVEFGDFAVFLPVYRKYNQMPY